MFVRDGERVVRGSGPFDRKKDCQRLFSFLSVLVLNLFYRDGPIVSVKEN